MSKLHRRHAMRGLFLASLLLATTKARAQGVAPIPGDYIKGIAGNFPGIDPTGTADSTTGLQAFLTACAGNTGYLPPGRYRTSATLTLSSNTVLLGGGLATQIFTTAGTGFNFINNKNFNATFNASTKIDQNITVGGIYFNYGSLNDGGTHAVSFRMAQNITVRDCYFNGGNNCTAMLACLTTLVENCHTPIGATGLTNVAYDHWDGAQDFTVRNCSAALLSAFANGCTATGTGTIGNEVRTTKNGTFEDCYFYGGGGYGIYVNAGASGCVCSDVMVRNVKLNGTAAGVAFQGTGGAHIIDGLWLENISSTGNCAVVTGSDASGSAPNDCTIENVVIQSCTFASVAGMMELAGLRHSVGKIKCIGVTLTGGTVLYFQTNSNGGTVTGPVTADAASISGITYGLYQGNGGAFDTNTQISCYDPFDGYFRNQGATPHFFEGESIP